MTEFEKRLAAFEEYFHQMEPDVAPQVTDIIDRFYRARTNLPAMAGLGDASSDILGSYPIGSSGPADYATATAATDTTDILGSFLNGLAQGLTNSQAAKMQLAQLQAAARVQQANVAASGSTKTTTIALFAGLALLAIIALKRK